MKKKIEKFNQKDTVLVVSAYPPRFSCRKNHGIAWYTKKLLSSHADRSDQRFVVLSERNGDNRPFVDADGKILVLRVFNRKRKSLYPRILTWLRKFENISEVHVHSEFATRGISHFVLLVPFLVLIRAMGKKITFFSHNVVEDIEVLAPNLGISGKWKKKVLNLALRAYYFMLSRLVNRIVVLDKVLAKRLSRMVQKEKIIVLPLSVDKGKSVSSVRIRRKLGINKGEKVILYFGFLTHYKGADWLIKEFDKLTKLDQKSDVRLVVAGGSSYSLSGTDAYDKYYGNLSEIAKKNEQISMMGHIANEEIAEYFALADLVVYPYRGFMGASGSMNHAFKYGRPFMVSSAMKSALRSISFDGRVKDDLVFELSRQGLGKVLETVCDHKKRVSLTKYSKKIAVELSSDKLVEREMSVLYDFSDRVRAHGQTQYAVQ